MTWWTAIGSMISVNYVADLYQTSTSTTDLRVLFGLGLRRENLEGREGGAVIAKMAAMMMDVGGGGGGGGGSTLSDIYQSSKKLLLRARDGIERLERLESSTSNGGLDSPDLSHSIKRDISQIQSLCFDMDRLWRSVDSKSHRDLWKRKVEQVAEEAESLKDSLDKYLLRNQRRMMEAKERAELLGRANGDSAHVLRIFDEEAQAMQSVRSSSRMLEESFATGTAILSKYAEQRERLKGAQRKALDVLNTVGLSNSVLRLIERRNRVDTWIKYVGMALVVIILYFFLRWTT
ncbi:V-SNARE_C domain-containing protein [Cephalotus follicularis]|uniref:V-SNARE_C domain-containing protein n=1 Tax=Cephalotus follicularis TaxID=3775 RepID=A0A1Q3D913_CEPFO|nr:V-SNARE_C domain-containing protein [Cephalotus follicularis]